MRAPLTFGASTAGTLNFAPSGCGFSRYRQVTLIDFGPVVAHQLLGEAVEQEEFLV